MKKIKFYALLVAILSLVLVGCGNTQTTTVKKEVAEVASLKTDQNVMVFSALSGANALSSTVTNLALSDSIGEEELPEIDMEKANSYLLMMENILADGGPVVATEAASDREGYDMMMVITVKDLAGNTSSYTIYYSILVDEEILPEETTPETEETSPETGETTPETEDTTTDENAEAPLAGKFGQNNHDYHDKGDKDDREDREEPKHEHHDKAYDQFKHHHHGDKEDEVEYDINALAVIDGVEYEVFGKKEVEEDDEEVEIKFIIKLDKDNYVKVEQEIEEDEVEYKYDVFKGRRMVSSLKFE